MLTWYILLFVNLTLSYFAEKQYNANKLLCKIFLAMIILFNVIILGLRDIGVGNDTLAYIEDYFIYSNQLSGIKEFLTKSYMDKGYVVLALIANLFSDKANSLMFITELFIITFLMMGIYEYKKVIKTNIFFFFMLFNFMYQFETINLMRQFCAMSLLFYGFSKYLQKKYVVYVVCQVISFFFHTSSIIFLIVPLFQYISLTNKTNRKVLLFSLIAFFIFFLYFFYMFIDFLDYNGIFMLKDVYIERYGGNSEYAAGGGGFSLKSILFFLIEIFLFFYVRKRHLVSDGMLYMFVVLSCSTFFLAQMINIIVHLFRLTLYPGIVLLVYISGFSKLPKIGVKNILYAFLFVAILSSIYFYSDSKLSSANLYFHSKILGIE